MRDNNINIDIDADNPVVMAFAGVVVAVPVDGMSPTDEAVAVGWTVKQAAPYVAGGLAALGSILATDNIEETKQREDEETQENQENREQQRNKRDGDSKGGPRRCGIRCLPSDDLRADGRSEDQIDIIKQQVEDDIRYDSWDKWRESLQEATNEPDVSEEEIQQYLDDIETIARSDDVRDYTSLIRQVQKNPNEEFHQTANEADRAVYYANHGQTVIIEPGTDDNIDLKTVDSSTDETEYIELKRITGTLSFNKADNLIGETDRKFNDASVGTSDDETVLEIRLPNPENSPEEIEDNIKDAIATQEIGGSVSTDEVRVFFGNEDEPTVTVDTDEVTSNDTNA